MNEIEKFEQERKERIFANADDKNFKDISTQWTIRSMELKYAYNFSWMGRPIIQHPQDMIAMQELFWKVQPDLLIETGIAHGGSVIYYASLMELLGGDGHVLGIDIDIRQHNRNEIEKHPMFKRITMFEGSSLDSEMVSKVAEFSKKYKRIMLTLDSNHTHDHVLNELRFYTPLVTPGSYCVVFDTVVEDMPKGSYSDRPWDKGNNPKTAVWEFLKTNSDFEIDREIENKLLITVAPEGYLKRIK